MRLSTLFLSFFISFSIIYADYTADVVLTDSEYNDIGAQYSIGTETVYVEVYDPDITGSLDVVFTSDTDAEGETVTLAEDATDVGYFRGSVVNLRVPGF